MTKHLPAHTQRLAQLVNRPGGLTAEEAVTAAEQSLASLRDRGLSDIAETIRAMQAVAAAIAPDGSDDGAAELYRRSDSLIGIAGVFGRAGLSDVALSLCTLIERLQWARRWDCGAIKLHLDSMRLLSADGVNPAHVEMIGTALRQVVDRLQPPAGAARIN